MKALILGDLHLTNKCPDNRTDNYEETVIQKFGFILNTAKDNKCDCIIQPGDFSDSPSLSYDFFIKISSMIRLSGKHIFTCWGQHDLRYRTKENTFLAALEEANDNLHILTKGPAIGFMGVDLYASAFGEEIPDIESSNKFNILITHRMIVNEKLWEGQTDCQYANSFLRLNKFNLIVSGDNHSMFSYKIGSRYLFNLGATMRSTINQIEHKPAVIIFDTEIKEEKYIPIPIEPAEKVFRMEKIEREKERNKELDAFVSGLSEHKEMGLSFTDNLNEYIKANKINTSIATIIKECSNG